MYLHAAYFSVEVVEHCNVGSSEAIDSVHVETKVGSVCVVILQGKL